MPPRQAPGQPSGPSSEIPDIAPREDGGPGWLGGVPEGYVVNRPGSLGQFGRSGGGGFTQSIADARTIRPPRQVTPTFREGDEFNIYGMVGPRLAALQAGLVAAGLLEEGTYAPGAIGGDRRNDPDPTLAAYRTLLGFANRAGFTTADAALKAYQKMNLTRSGGAGFGDGGAGGGGGGGLERLPAPVTNADDLRRVFRAAVIDTLGTGWSDQQINTLVADYQAHERAYNNQIAMGEAPEEQIPSVETFAVNAAREADPVEAQGQQFLGAANTLSSMLGRWSG